jgi:hypothetical protein
VEGLGAVAVVMEGEAKALVASEAAEMAGMEGAA